METMVDDPARFFAVVQQLLRELRGQDGPPLQLDDELERTLGIDSLARMELMLRLEGAFGVRLPEAMVQNATTLRDLLRALQAAAPRGQGGAPAAPPPPPCSVGAPAIEPPRQAATLAEVLDWHAARSGPRVHLRLLADESAEHALTHAELLERARAAAAGLQRAGVMPGDSVALMLPTGWDFFEAFAGIGLAGAVPVPIYPPFRAAQIQDHLRRQAVILDNARAVLLVSDERSLPAARILRAGAPLLRGVRTVAQLRDGGGRWEPVARRAHDTALLQYTSGSTGAPKGVVLTHANLLANVRAMGRALAASSADVFVSWLPLYHDMGLIGAWLGSLYHGVPLVVMPPQSFLARPARWLQALSRHRGTLSAAPNFAYEILASRVPEDELHGLDLSAWRVAANGAEPVRAETLSRFAERFARHGFDAKALLPVYGLAESGVGLVFPPLGRGPRIDSIDRSVLQARGRAQAVPPGQAGAMRVVCCGLPLEGHEIRVADARGVELPERWEGRVEFRGPSATSGYLDNAEATRALFHGDWLDSGDVGYVAGGELYLTSRVKDLIIRGGHNIHPYDLEEAVGRLPGIRKGCVAVFGAQDPVGATDRIVVLAESAEPVPDRRARMQRDIAELSISLLGVPADDVVLAPPHTVLKTSSGKIRRAACRALYEERVRAAAGGPLDWSSGGRLQALLGPRRWTAAAGPPLAWQLARMWVDALVRRLAGPWRRAAGWLYAAWAWACFGVAALLAVLVALWPAAAQRGRAARALARAVLRAAGLPLEVRGQARLVPGCAVIVANHASYLDWLVLCAVLPAGVGFVAKRELGRFALARWFLQRMGTQLVTRHEVHASVEDARALLQAVRRGQALVFFPEGGLTRAPGLRGFHLGAFVTAAQAGVPLQAVSLRGTRSVLRDGAWLPRREPVRVQVHPALQPRGSDWNEALRLRRAARDSIAAECAEPVLNPAP